MTLLSSHMAFRWPVQLRRTSWTREQLQVQCTQSTQWSCDTADSFVWFCVILQTSRCSLVLRYRNPTHDSSDPQSTGATSSGCNCTSSKLRWVRSRPGNYFTRGPQANLLVLAAGPPPPCVALPPSAGSVGSHSETISSQSETEPDVDAVLSVLNQALAACRHSVKVSVFGPNNATAVTDWKHSYFNQIFMQYHQVSSQWLCLCFVCRSRCVMTWQRGSTSWRTAGGGVDWACLSGDAWTHCHKVTCLTTPDWSAQKNLSYLSSCPPVYLSELKSAHWDSANEIHRSLMVDHVAEVSQWMVGVKRLIAETRNLSPEILEFLQKPTEPVLEPVEKVQDSVESNEEPAEPTEEPAEPTEEIAEPVQD